MNNMKSNSDLFGFQECISQSPVQYLKHINVQCYLARCLQERGREGVVGSAPVRMWPQSLGACAEPAPPAPPAPAPPAPAPGCKHWAAAR